MSFLQKMGVKFGKNNIPDKKSGMVAADTLLQQTLQSVQNSDFLDGHALLEQDNITLPIFGTGSVNSHQRKLLVILAISGMALVASFGWVLRENDRAAQQVAATGQALMQAQRVAKSGTQALLGVPHAFIELKNSVQVFASNARGLAQGDAALNLVPVKESYQADVQAMLKQAETTEKNAKAVLKQEDVLIKVAQALRNVNQQSSALLDLSETVGSLLMQDKIIREEIEAITQMGMLTQRIGKSANEFQSIEGVNPEAVFLLGKDLNTFQEIVKGLLTGNEELGLPGTSNPQARQQLATLLAQYEATRTDAETILSNLQGLVSAREAQSAVVGDSEPLREKLEALQQRLSADAGVGLVQLAVLGGLALIVLLSGIGIARVALLDSRQRQQQAEQQQREARLQEQEAKRINDANQAAILRLMNELQNLADGDLTQEATVTEDITGAIADSVNYTVEELRLLVGSVQKTASQVVDTTTQVDNTSAQLLAISTEQLREIRATGQAILDMAQRITEVSAQAQSSAEVANQSLLSAEQGQKAVQDTIGGMNAIRDQMQETSKRIKRLGESSQEIGEITELISDITEQTNVLALNAAIQAASAGEAGRGFSVVAEEVQRLAERSGEATRQIATLVRTIQTDTQDTVAAMERATLGVVEGARLSDSAGAALAEIHSVSRRLAQLIDEISKTTQHEASLANEVADDIQHIFVVTEQTGEGTRSTAEQVRELARMAQELRQSVTRFRIA
ncbi:type IV pili methyl-accepting chemotaxis transducer N-terminal domain-containing protein [Comamonas denitrificans]|uniref:Type IV pili methyl-accepting chemotaxis transducer N-terminal domain-containing protein n=2 Tax=Pseudomonadota TaxID=1224 RepID=A0A939KFT9_9BURK|nr:methyl-accepting chemotaxis protein [Comamonas denitrificans]MBO1250743.1 type IV pili methyl-accepting chemotaxis transducer N-terminal domain-containing protein [Comamonas denitrificans]